MENLRKFIIAKNINFLYNENKQGGVMGKDVTLKEGDDFVFPRTFARNVFIDNESLETILAMVEARLKALEENSGSGNQGTTVVANPGTASTDELYKIQIENTTHDVGGIEIIREDK